MYWIPSTSLIFTSVFGRAHRTNKWKLLKEIPTRRPISTPKQRQTMRQIAQVVKSFLFVYHSFLAIPKSI